MLKRFLKTTKGKVTAICSGVALVAVVAAVAVMLILNNNKYRSISVADVKGIVNVIGQKNNGQAYKGQRLFDGDDVSVMEDSELTLCLNNDKYVYADENTHFKLEASSSKQGNKLKIVLDKGSELNVLTAKLGDGDTYQVDTPNSTMSVRGTRFRMTVYTGDDGYTYTLLEVESGIVLAQLKTLTGDYNGVEKEFFAGQSALIRGGDDFSEFVLSEDNAEVWLLDYKSLPSEAVPRLIELLKKGEELEAAAKEAEEKAVTDTDEKDKNQVAEKDPDKDKEANKETDADKDKEKEADKDSKDGKDKDSKDGKDKDAKDNKDTAKDNKDNKETADNTAQQNNNDSGNNQNNNDNGNNNVGEQPVNKPQPSTNPEPVHTHIAGDWVVTTKPGCETAGTKVKKCTGCGEVLETASIDPTGHNMKETTSPSCTTAGEKKCQNPNCNYSETIPPKGHNIVETKTDSTCTTAGNIHKECSVCHDKTTISDTPIPMKPHDYTVWKAVPGCEATCQHDGLEECVCSVCGAADPSSQRGYGPLPHTPDPSSRLAGQEIAWDSIGNPITWEIWYTCSECGSSFTVSEDHP